MYQRLSEIRLKTGEAVELGVLSGPDDSAFAAQLRSLLGHKGRVWQWQIEQSLAAQHPGVESRFYVLSKNGRPFANIMTVERAGIGIFGHVYTRPEERRKGAAEIIQRSQMEDFQRRGGRALYLGTGFDTPPYHLYARHGFAGIESGSGYMAWFAQGQDAFEREVFAGSRVRHEQLSFEHWPLLPALAMMRHPARARILNMDVLGPCSTEGGALPVLIAMAQAAEHPAENSARAWVAVSEKSGAPVAIACVKPEHYFGPQVDVLDLFCAPGFESELGPLLVTLQLSPERPVICYADLVWPAKQEVLRSSGFERAAVLKSFIRVNEQLQDVELWTRKGS